MIDAAGAPSASVTPDRPCPGRRAATTVAAGLLAVALTAPYAYLAVESSLVAWGPRTLDPRSARALTELALSDVEAANLVVISIVVLGVVSLYVVVLAVNLLRRRQWARHAAILSFLFFGVTMLPFAVAGVLADPPATNAWLGILLGVGDLAVVALLLTPSASDDFGDAEWFRDRRSGTGSPGG